jgi:hypothetical protein
MKNWMKSGEPRKTKMNHSAGLRRRGWGRPWRPQAHGEEEAEAEREHGEIDIPDHARADQDDLFADADIRARQQALADADGPSA